MFFWFTDGSERGAEEFSLSYIREKAALNESSESPTRMISFQRMLHHSVSPCPICKSKKEKDGRKVVGGELFSNNDVNYQGQTLDLHTLPDFIQAHPSLCWHPGRKPHWFCGHHLCAWHSLTDLPLELQHRGIYRADHRSSGSSWSFSPRATALSHLLRPHALLSSRGPSRFFSFSGFPVPCCQGESVPPLISICSQHITQI